MIAVTPQPGPQTAVLAPARMSWRSRSTAAFSDTVRVCVQVTGKYSSVMLGGPYTFRPRVVDPKLVPAARKGLASPWAVSGYMHVLVALSVCVLSMCICMSRCIKCV